MTQSSSTLETWPRQHYSPGGGDAFLVYLVFGQFKEPMELSRSKYRTNGPPSTLNVRAHAPWLDEPSLRELVAHDFPKIESAMPELHHAISTAPQCVSIMGTIKDPPNLDYLRDTIGFITAMLENGGVAVYDPQKFTWWQKSDWIRDIFEPNGPVPRNHCIILVSEEGGTDRLWVHTRGVRKFGRPDISVRNVPHENLNEVVDLCNRFIEHQAFGLVVPEGQPIKTATLPPGMTCHHAGDLDDPDYNNVHFEIRYP